MAARDRHKSWRHIFSVGLISVKQRRRRALTRPVRKLSKHLTRIVKVQYWDVNFSNKITAPKVPMRCWKKENRYTGWVTSKLGSNLEPAKQDRYGHFACRLSTWRLKRDTRQRYAEDTSQNEEMLLPLQRQPLHQRIKTFRSKHRQTSDCIRQERSVSLFRLLFWQFVCLRCLTLRQLADGRRWRRLAVDHRLDTAPRSLLVWEEGGRRRLL